MKVLIISGTPKKEGLACSCVNVAYSGATQAGGECEIANLRDYQLNRCEMCGEGWGTCRESNTCSFGEDGFTEIQKKIAEADAYILDTPVYWGDMTEAMKAFFDRYRRCEAFKGDACGMAGKPVLLIASPGGSGNGMISCLEQMERLCHHLHAKIYDYVGVNRWNKDYKLVTIRDAAASMVKNAK